MLFLLLSPLALDIELSERVTRKWKPLGHSVFYSFIMQPVSYFTVQSHTWLSGVSLWTYRCRQQRQVEGKTANTNTNAHLSIKAWPYFVSLQKSLTSVLRVSYLTWDKTELKKGNYLYLFVWEIKRKRVILTSTLYPHLLK